MANRIPVSSRRASSSNPVARQVAFSGGLIAPALHGRVDYEKYGYALSRCENFFVRREGGVSNRPGTEYIASTKDHDKASRLVSFSFSSSQAFMLEFGEGYIRFYKEGSQVVVSSDDAVLWAATTYYLAGRVIRNSSSNVYYCSVAGQSGATEPTWGTTEGVEITDGTCKWVYIGALGCPYQVPTLSLGWQESQLSGLHFSQVGDEIVVTTNAVVSQVLRRYENLRWTIAEFSVGNALPVPTSLTIANTLVTASSGGYPYPARDWDWVVTSLDDDGRESAPSAKHSLLVGDGKALFPDCTPAKLTWSSGSSAASTLFPSTNAAVSGGGYTSPTNAMDDDSDYAEGLVDTGGADKEHKWTFAGDVATGTLYIAHSFVSEAWFNEEKMKMEDTTGYQAICVQQSGGAKVEVARRTHLSSRDVVIVEVPITSVDLDTLVVYAKTDNTDSGDAAGVRGRVHSIYFIAAGVVATRYNVYRGLNGVYGYIGTTEDEFFWDGLIAPQYGLAPPKEMDPFADPYSWPAASCVYEQRRFMGGPLENPLRLLASKPGEFENFDVTIPSQDDDSLDLILASRRYDGIVGLVPLQSSLLVLTAGGISVLSVGEGGVLTPSQFSLTHSYGVKCGSLQALVIGDSAIITDSTAQRIHKVSYSNEENAANAAEISILASHLFGGYQIVSWAWASIPFSALWAVRSDGKLLCCTYLPEHDMIAWSLHETDGEVESVETITEDGEDRVYMIVNRTIDGSTKRYVERLASRDAADLDIDDAIFVDCALRYDGYVSDGTTLTLTQNETTGEITATASASKFVSGDVGDHLYVEVSGEQIRIAITGYTSGTVVTGALLSALPDGVLTVAQSTWAIARSSFSGLSHLEGETVGGLADGAVIAEVTVSSGAISIGHKAAKLIVGLPYESLIRGLPLASVSHTLSMDTKKSLAAVTAMVHSSRGLWFGTDEERLVEHKQRSASDGFSIASPFTGVVRMAVSSAFAVDQAPIIKQVDPLPCTILCMECEVAYGG